MFKKINQYLLTHYPLVWNLKLVWILLIGFIINCIAFVNGYLHYSNIKQMTNYNVFNVFYQELYSFYYFIVILIILIIWIYFYIKNNRFKSKYPTSRNYLYKEFLGVFVILLFFISVPNTFNFGLNTRIANFLTDEQFAKEVDLFNRVQPFTLQHKNGYANNSRNLSVPIFDTLVSEQEVLTLYTENKKEFIKLNPKSNYRELEEPYFRNPEFNDLLVQKLASKFQFTNVYFENPHYSYDQEIIRNDYTYPDLEIDSVLVVEDITTHVPTIHSLYNYSYREFEVPNHPEYTQKYYDEELHQLLQTNDNKKIEELLTTFQNKLDEYKIGYRFKDKSWIDYVNQSPYYFISINLTQSTYTKGKKTFYKDYINIEPLKQLYSNINTAKYSNSFFDNYQFFVTATLMLALIIVMFRFTSFKVWLISAVGFGILCIVGVCIGLTLSFLGVEFYNEYIISLLFYLLFAVIVFVGLKNNRNKLITGINLNWLVGTSVFLILVLLNFYREIRHDMIYKAEVLKEPTISRYDIYNHPELQLIDKITEWYFYFNPIIILIAFYFMVNAFKKWQAMAEE